MKNYEVMWEMLKSQLGYLQCRGVRSVDPVVALELMGMISDNEDARAEIASFIRCKAKEAAETEAGEGA